MTASSWVAVIVVLPAPSIVTVVPDIVKVVPDIVATAVSELV